MSYIIRIMELVTLGPQEVQKLQQDVMKKKQEMLEMQIQCQKVDGQLWLCFHAPLIPCRRPHLCDICDVKVIPFQALLNKLEKLRGAELERARVMKMLKELTAKISKLREETKPAPRVAFRAVESKSKMDVSLAGLGSRSPARMSSVMVSTQPSVFTP